MEIELLFLRLVWTKWRAGRHCNNFWQSGAAANFGDHAHRQIWGPNVNNNIYILKHEYSSTGFEWWLVFAIVKFGEPEVEIPPFWRRNLGINKNREKTPLFDTKAAISFLMPQGACLK